MQIALSEDHKPRPSMTPVIDVVFNLLIFFLLASQFARAERDQSITVPQVSYIQAVAQMPRNLVVNVSAEGRYSVLNQEYKLADLDSVIGLAASQNPDQQVIIRCDGETRVRAQAAVMELCNKHEVHNIAITLAEKRGR